jgi:hypothetical protein
MYHMETAVLHVLPVWVRVQRKHVGKSMRQKAAGVTMSRQAVAFVVAF